jgi:hypothetical protein
VKVGFAPDALFRLRRAKPRNYSGRMKAWRILVRLLAGVVGSVVLAVVLFFAFIMVRKSVPYVLRGVLEQLAASGPYNNQELATAICGKPVDFLGSAETKSPVLALPRARLLSWRLAYPSVGTASARVVGVGVRRPDWRDPKSDYAAITGICEATITFKYRCVRADNGRAVVLETEFLEGPKVVSRP